MKKRVDCNSSYCCVDIPTEKVVEMDNDNGIHEKEREIDAELCKF
jgi:hypothetical protein